MSAILIRVIFLMKVIKGKELVGSFSQDSEVGRSYGEEKAVIGYFGEEGAESVPTVSVKAPVIEVINAERLLVKITDPNTEKVRIRLIVEQEKSGKKEIKLIKKNNGPDTDLKLVRRVEQLRRLRTLRRLYI